MIRWEISPGAKAIFSTAVELSPALKTRAESYFGCPVIDWYSSTETGPVAFSAPDGRGLQVAAPDIYVETLDERGFPAAPGAVGELAVTGGRNPYVPLLRYRTGDFARIEDGRIVELHAREMVFFRAADGAVINPVDIGRIMRLHCAFAQHQFTQHPDAACTVRIRPTPGLPVDAPGLSRKLATLFGESAPIEIIIDPELGDGQPGGKVQPYVQLMPFT
jgi:phenylacetate-CoA ligase